MLKRDRLWKGAILSSVLLILILADYLYLKAEYHLITESCLSMFTGGNFLSLDANQKTSWNPSCKLMHWKKLNGSTACLRKRSLGQRKANHIVLLGDSRIRQLRDGLIYHLTGMEHDVFVNTTVTKIEATADKHGGTVTVKPIANLRIEFFWMVEMDAGDGALGAALRGLKLRKSKPDLIMIGSGVWIIKRCTAENITQDICLEGYQKYCGR